MSLPRECKELMGLIETALRYVNDPSTLEQLCENSKQLCRRPDKVKQCLTHLVIAGTVEHYGEEYMLAENVSDIIRDHWKKEVQKRKENFTAEPKLTYAEVVRRNGRAPDMMDGACGSDAQEMEENRRSTNAILPDIETQATAVFINPVFVFGPQIIQYDQNVHVGDNASVQIGNQNGMNFQQSSNRQ